MSKGKKTYWFPAKRYGWGWGIPSVWQGWLVLIAFVVVISIVPFVFDPNDDLLPFLAATLGAAGSLIGICYAKGEPPKWRWGDSDDK